MAEELTPSSGVLWYRLLNGAAPFRQGDQFFGVKHPDRPQGPAHDLIICTQSCDIEQRRTPRIFVAPAYPLVKWLYANPAMLDRLGELARGRMTGYYLLPPYPGCEIDAACGERVVDFSAMDKISIKILTDHVAQGVPWLRLEAPRREHFSQHLALYFMRVALEGSPEPPQLIKGDRSARCMGISSHSSWLYGRGRLARPFVPQRPGQ